jgi:hypothetical protein
VNLVHLYILKSTDHSAVHVVARTPQEALDLFVTWSAADGRVHPSATVQELGVDELPHDQQEPVRRALAAGLVGVAHYDQAFGWTFSPPIWQPLGVCDALVHRTAPAPGHLRLFEFRDTAELSALVLAADHDDATEMFEEYTLAEGGDPDGLLWREISLRDLMPEAQSAVHDAMRLKREGLVIFQAEGRWLFLAVLDSCSADGAQR